MGEEADGILGLSNDDRKKYNTVSNNSKAHFLKPRNRICKRTGLICVDKKKENL